MFEEKTVSPCPTRTQGAYDYLGETPPTSHVQEIVMQAAAAARPARQATIGYLEFGAMGNLGHFAGTKNQPRY